jgi:hypothetical protein
LVSHQERPRDLARRRRSNRPEGTVLPPGTMEVTLTITRPVRPALGAWLVKAERVLAEGRDDAIPPRRRRQGHYVKGAGL